MSGHNKWSSIKHKKAKEDAKKGKAFTKIIRMITVAARDGGGDPENNADLRTALDKANAVNMPKENIERAIKRGIGELEGVRYEASTLEGYGPNGVAIFVELLTDNRNRTIPAVRHTLNKFGGTLAEKGSVAWNFESKGMIMILRNKYEEDELMMTALECGAEDFITQDEYYIIYTDPKEFHKVKQKLEQQDIEIESAELTMIPKNTVNMNDNAQTVIKLINELEDNDDIQHVYANFEIDDEILERISDV